MVHYCVVHCPAHVTRVCVPVEHFYQFPALLENWFLSCKGNAQGRHFTGDMNGQQCCYDLSACTSMQNSNYSVKERLGLHWINLIHFVISACIHSDYIDIYLFVVGCYRYYSEPLLSTRCPPPTAPLPTACMRRCKLFALSWHFIFAMASSEARLQGTRLLLIQLQHLNSSCWISLHLNICAGPWVLVVCKSKQSLVIGYGRRGNHRQKGTN